MTSHPVYNTLAHSVLNQNASNLVNVLVLQKKFTVSFEVNKAKVVENGEVLLKLFETFLIYFLKVDHLGSHHGRLSVADREVDWLFGLD